MQILGGLGIYQDPFLTFSYSETIAMSFKENPYVKDAVFFLATIVVSMAGFWMLTGKDLISRSEAANLVDQKTISIGTKLELYHEALIDHEQQINKQKEKLERILEKNTEAINSLRIQIATLSHALKSLTDNNITP